MSTFTVNCLDSKAHFETVSFDNIEYNSVNDYFNESAEINDIVLPTDPISANSK